jgi:deoxyribonucleoside regulator
MHICAGLCTYEQAVSAILLDTTSADTRLLVRVALMYYRLHLTQEQIGEQLGMSRFKVGRLLDRAVRESIVRIDVVHPTARLLALEDALVERFALRGAVVADVPIPESDGSAAELVRESVARAAVEFLADLRPAGSIGVSWGRTMSSVARQLVPGWTAADEIVQLNGAISRSSRPTRATEIAERFGTTSGAAIRLLAAPAIVGSRGLRLALEADPTVRETIAAARAARTAVFSLGMLGRGSVLVESGHLTERDLGALSAAGSVGDVVGRFLLPDGRIARTEIDERTIGLSLAEIAGKQAAIGIAAGPGRGPITLAALRSGCVNVLVVDGATAEWVLSHA